MPTERANRWCGLFLGRRVQVPLQQFSQVLDGVEDLVEGEVGASPIGARRCAVRNAWAAVTRVTW